MEFPIILILLGTANIWLLINYRRKLKIGEWFMLLGSFMITAIAFVEYFIK